MPGSPGQFSCFSYVQTKKTGTKPQGDLLEDLPEKFVRYFGGNFSEAAFFAPLLLRSRTLIVDGNQTKRNIFTGATSFAKAFAQNPGIFSEVAQKSHPCQVTYASSLSYMCLLCSLFKVILNLARPVCPRDGSHFVPGRGPICPRDSACLSRTLSRRKCLCLLVCFLPDLSLFSVRLKAFMRVDDDVFMLWHVAYDPFKELFERGLVYMYGTQLDEKHVETVDTMGPWLTRLPFRVFSQVTFIHYT